MSTDYDDDDTGEFEPIDDDDQVEDLDDDDEYTPAVSTPPPAPAPTPPPEHSAAHLYEVRQALAAAAPGSAEHASLAAKEAEILAAWDAVSVATGLKPPPQSPAEIRAEQAAAEQRAGDLRRPAGPTSQAWLNEQRQKERDQAAARRQAVEDLKSDPKPGRIA